MSFAFLFFFLTFKNYAHVLVFLQTKFSSVNGKFGGRMSIESTDINILNYLKKEIIKRS